MSAETRTIHRYDDPDPGAWQRFVGAMHSGQVVEIDREMFYYWLEVLPPVFMNRVLAWPDPRHPVRYDFGFAEGAEPVTVFWRSRSRRDGTEQFFCRRTDIVNRP